MVKDIRYILEDIKELTEEARIKTVIDEAIGAGTSISNTCNSEALERYKKVMIELIPTLRKAYGLQERPALFGGSRQVNQYLFAVLIAMIAVLFYFFVQEVIAFKTTSLYNGQEREAQCWTT